MIYNNHFQLNTIGVPDFSDIKSLSYAARLSSKLIYYLSSDSHRGRYKDFFICKRNGGVRKISAPCYSLKMLQRWVLEEILYKAKVSPYSYGFVKINKTQNQDTMSKTRKDFSPIKDVASRHVKNLYILKMDLKDFFPSVDRKRIFAQFIKMGYGSYASSLLTEICTHEGVLPQGAVTSPYLASVVCYQMDMRIAGYCNKRGITYTRYADDMVFSSDDRSGLRGIYGMISRIIKEEGFCVNEQKTQFLSRKSRREVLGLILNNDKYPLVPRELKRKVKAMIHYQIVSGDYTEYSKLLGYISYIESVEKGYKDRVKKYIDRFRNDRIALFPDAVSEFNKHKFFRDIPDMEELEIEDFVDKTSRSLGSKGIEEYEELMSDIYNERQDFIQDRKRAHT